MKLIDIVRAAQDRYTDMNVIVDTHHGTVSIEDCNNFLDSIFMQGDEAYAFIDEAKALWDELEYVTIEECYHYLAISYAENIWG